MDKTKQRETYKSAAAAMLGLLLASIVLFPAAVGVLKSPYYYDLALWLYLGSFFVSSVFLAIAYYLAAWTERDPPHKLGSIGLGSAIFCMLSFVWFFFGNIGQDQAAPPEITSLVGDKFCVERGGSVTLTAEGIDQSGDSLRWIWTVTPSQPKPGAGERLSSAVRTAAWHVPAGTPPGDYEVKAVATDGDAHSGPQALIVKVKEKCGG